MGQKSSVEARDVRTIFRTVKIGLLLVATGAFLTNPVLADNDGEPKEEGIRGEIWLAMTSWQSLSDLQPVAGGSFKSVGYGLGGAAHWPLALTTNTDLFVGIEGAVFGTDSDIPVILDELLARDFYLAASLKWKLGKARRFSLDAGAAYHLLDITQLDTDYRSSAEFESWEEDVIGPFVGMTWDFGESAGSDSSGATLGLRAHFLDFGTVRDEDVLASVVLGRDAGKLDGPLIMLHIGYRW